MNKVIGQEEKMGMNGWSRGREDKMNQSYKVSAKEFWI